MKWRGTSNDARSPGVESDAKGKCFGQLPHRTHVSAGLRIAKLGSECEAFEHLDSRALQLDVAMRQHLLQRDFLLLEREVQKAGAQHVVNAQNELAAVEWLREKIGGAESERPASCVGNQVTREDEHWHELVIGMHRVQSFEHIEAVEARHVQIEHHEIRLRRTRNRDRVGGIRCRSHFVVAGSGKDTGDEFQAQRLVVNDENTRRTRPRRTSRMANERG